MKCVLILEDEHLIALDLKYACDDAGLGSIVARTLAQACEELNRRSFDGAVLDVNLGGGETCEAVAHLLRARGIPFVLNTGDLDRAGEFLREINAPIIAKPSSADSVIARLLELA
jgi:DNA-binding response OmpR family regulator